MACETPSTTSDCTNVSPCASGGCGCGETSATPILPKCQDTNLIAGTFHNATIVVSDGGCIVSVTEGEPEQYTPDECCGGSGGGGTGTQGPRGEKGDPGAAATLSVNPVIVTGTDASWHVENTGTASAAVFKFTAPSTSGSGSSSTSGVTGELNGFIFEAGLVKQIPTNIVTKATATAEGTRATLFSFDATPVLSGTNIGRVDFGLNLDAFYSDLTSAFTAQNDAQAEQIADLTSAVSDLINTISGLQSNLSDLQTTLATQQGTIADIQAELGDLRGDFNAYVASHP